MITDTRKVLDPPTPNKNNGVLLQVVPDTRNIRSNLDSVRQTDPGNLTKCGVRLLRGRSIHPRAHPPLLRTTLKSRRCRLLFLALPATANQLVNRRHRSLLPIPAQRGILPAEATKISARQDAVKSFFIFFEEGLPPPRLFSTRQTGRHHPPCRHQSRPGVVWAQPPQTLQWRPARLQA